MKKISIIECPVESPNTIVIEIDKKDCNKMSALFILDSNIEIELLIDKSTIKLANTSLCVIDKTKNKKDYIVENMPIDFSTPIYLMIKHDDIQIESRYISMHRPFSFEVFCNSRLDDSDVDEVIMYDVLDDNESDFKVSARLDISGNIDIFKNNEFFKENIFSTNVDSFNITFHKASKLNDLYNFIYNLSKTLQNSTPELINCYLDNTRFNLDIITASVLNNDIIAICVDESSNSYMMSSVYSVVIKNPVPFVILSRIMSDIYSTFSLDTIDMSKIESIVANRSIRNIN